LSKSMKTAMRVVRGSVRLMNNVVGLGARGLGLKQEITSISATCDEPVCGADEFPVANAAAVVSDYTPSL